MGTYTNGVYEVTNAFGVYFTIEFNPTKNEDEVSLHSVTKNC